MTQFSYPNDRTPLKVSESHSDSAVTVKVENPDADATNKYFNDGSRVRIEVFVPRKSNLKINATGEIRIDGVSGNIELTGGDETINVRDSDGSLNVTNGDGQVRIVGFRGDLNAKTADGEIRMDGDFSSIVGSARDGSFVLTVPENFDGDIVTPGDRFIIEDLPNNKRLSGNKWRFGNGGRTYQFSAADGRLTIQNRDLIEGN
jgi:hypothetical protein